MVLKKFIDWLDERMAKTQPPVMAFGIFGLINYPIFFLYWHSLTPQLYTSAELRVIAILLCIPLVLKRFWPQKLYSFFSLYWFFSLLFCLPFFGTLLFLLNQGSAMWLLNMMLILFLLILLVDWLMFITLLVLGVGLGVIAYQLISGGPYQFLLEPSMLGAFSTFLWAIIIGMIFSHNTARNLQIRDLRNQVQSIHLIANSVAHELRTPLGSIKLGIQGFLKYLPTLIEAYQLAKQHDLPVKRIRKRQFSTMQEMADKLEGEVNSANTIIDMLLMRSNVENVQSMELETCSMRDCIQEALKRYPFKNNDERNLIHWADADNDRDFAFQGNRTYMIHVLFNLIKNALHYIHEEGRGEIKIWMVHQKDFNILHVCDTAKGIPSEKLSSLFEQFYSKRKGGTGIGLAFCKMVMESFYGEIVCDSEEGKYTDFQMYFPVISKNEQHYST